MKIKWKALILALCLAIEGVPVSAAGINDDSTNVEIKELDESIEVVETDETTVSIETVEAGEDNESIETVEADEDNESIETVEAAEIAEINDAVETDEAIDHNKATEMDEKPIDELLIAREEELASLDEMLDVMSDTEQTLPEIGNVYEDTMDLSEWMISAGGFPDRNFFGEDSENEPEILGVDVATEAAYKAEVYRALANREPVIYVEAFRIDIKRAGKLYLDVCNEYPDLFYVGPKTQYRHDGTYILELYPKYVYSKAQVAEVEQLAWRVVGSMGANWGTERKLMYLHDYIVMNCTYDYSYSNYDLYNVLIEHTAVCQGYAEAYIYLAQKAGIPVELVTSESINHAWNMVKINGKYYYIDCTWDDEGNDAFGKFGNYQFFLKSDGEFDHDGCDWYCTRFGYVNGIAAASTEYDFYFWSNCSVPVPYVQDTAAYIKSSETDGIYLHYGNGAERKIAFPKAFTWSLWEESDIWDGIYTNVVSVGDFFCLHSSDTIYGLSSSGEIWPIYILSDSERKKGYIYGMTQSQSGAVNMYLAHGPSSSITLLKEIPKDILMEGKNAVWIDGNAFPDSVFREVVKEFDKNNSGKLSKTEMDAVTWMDCSSTKTNGSAISSLKGIENFKNLTGLNCAGQLLTKLDVSSFKNLETLACNNNCLTSLTISKNSKLKKIYCQNNEITALALGNNVNIEVLSCQNNKIKSLNLEKYKALKEAYLRGKKTNISNTSNTATGYSFRLSQKGGEYTLSYDNGVKIQYGTRFLDVPSDQWYVKAVDYAYDQQIMSGTGDLLFAPEAILTREQFVTVLYNHAKRPTMEKKVPFMDVKSKDYYYNPVGWAYTNKITSGVESKKFGTGLNITREQLVTMLYAYADYCEYDLKFSSKALNGFADVKKVSSWATDAMKWGVSKGVISGKPSNDGKKMYLDPKGNATRAECAQMMKNLIEKLGTK